MPSNSTYSFGDIIASVYFPGYAMQTLNGFGLGEMTITYADANTVQERSADGSVMTSKIIANNGQVAITIQQTSLIHHELKAIFNGLYFTPGGTWASGVINVSSPAGTFDEIICSNVAFEKRPDQPYQQQGQMVTWNFLAGNIQYVY